MMAILTYHNIHKEKSIFTYFPLDVPLLTSERVERCSAITECSLVVPGFLGRKIPGPLQSGIRHRKTALPDYPPIYNNGSATQLNPDRWHVLPALLVVSIFCQ